MRWRPHRHSTTEVLLDTLDRLDRRGLRWLFRGLISEIEFELLLRDLAGIAEELGGHCVGEIGGFQ